MIKELQMVLCTQLRFEIKFVLAPNYIIMCYVSSPVMLKGQRKQIEGWVQE